MQSSRLLSVVWVMTQLNSTRVCCAYDNVGVFPAAAGRARFISQRGKVSGPAARRNTTSSISKGPRAPVCTEAQRSQSGQTVCFQGGGEKKRILIKKMNYQ